MTGATETTSDPANRAASIGNRPKAFLSYTSRGDDSNNRNIKVTVGRLEEELRLRGFEVFLDTSSIGGAAPIEAEIFDEIDRSDIFIAVLTPEYLERDYCLKEFRRARDRSRSGTCPRIYPVAIGIGDDRETVQQATWEQLRFDFSAYWIDSVFINFDREDAAEVARCALNHVFPADTGPTDDGWRINLISRGSPSSFEGLKIDASLVFGGSVSEVGTAEDWERLHCAVTDVEAVLRAHGPRRRVVLTPQCHLPAALMFGWVFRRNAGWTFSVMQGEMGCATDVQDSAPVLDFEVEDGSFDSGGGRLAISLDVVGRSIDSAVRHSYQQPPRGYLWCSSTIQGDLNAAQIGAAAVEASDQIIARRDDYRPSSLDVFLATPAAFAALVGHRLGAIHCSIDLFEVHKETHEYSKVISMKEK